MKKIAIPAFAALLASTGLASAASISFEDFIVLTTTNWTDTVSVQQFDSSLGTLTSADVILTGAVFGSAEGESRDAAAADITLSLSAEISATNTDLGGVATVLPIVDSVFSATAFDGSTDFGGTSGVAFVGLTATDTDTAQYSAAADLVPFIGSGLISFDLDAQGASSGSGAGNLITAFATDARATLTVVYNYDAAVTPPPVAPIPLPAGAPLLLAGLGAFAIARRVKNAK